MKYNKKKYKIFWSSDINDSTGQAIVSKRVFDKINNSYWLKLTYLSELKFIHVYIFNIIKLYFYVFLGKTKTAYVVPSRTLIGFLRDIPVLLISFLDIRIVLHIHGDGLNTLFKKKYIGYFASILYSKTEIIIPCKHLANFIIKPKSISIVENYSEFFITSTSKLSTSKEIKLLWNSNIMATKGIKVAVDGLLKASSYNINFNLTILGKPLGDPIMNQSQIESFSNNLRNHKWVNFLGTTSSKKVFEIIKKHDIVILLSNNECQPMALIEAMCCGLKLIVSDIPGIRNTVGNYPAYYIKRNKSSFAKAFFCASKAPPIDDKFIKDAIKRFSPKRFENQMKKILEI
jgi:glycosyltransferase involved in cell wall biosynthesis